MCKLSSNLQALASNPPPPLVQSEEKLIIWDSKDERGRGSGEQLHPCRLVRGQKVITFVSEAFQGMPHCVRKVRSVSSLYELIRSSLKIWS